MWTFGFDPLVSVIKRFDDCTAAFSDYSHSVRFWIFANISQTLKAKVCVQKNFLKTAHAQQVYMTSPFLKWTLDKPLGKVNKHYFTSRYNESFPRNLPLFKEYLKTGQTGNVPSLLANEL